MKCFKCKNEYFGWEVLLKHFRLAHNLGINDTIQCYEGLCFSFFQNMKSFRRHLIKKHPNTWERSSLASVEYLINNNSKLNLSIGLDSNKEIFKTSEPSHKILDNCEQFLRNSINNHSNLSLDLDSNRESVKSSEPSHQILDNISSNIDSLPLVVHHNVADQLDYNYDLTAKMKTLKIGASNFLLKLHAKNNFSRKDVEDIKELLVEHITTPLITTLSSLLDNKNRLENYDYLCKCALDQGENLFSESFRSDYSFYNYLHENELLMPLRQFTIDNSISEIYLNGETVYDEDKTHGILMPLKFQFKSFFEKNDNLLKMFENMENISKSDAYENFINGELWKKKALKYVGKKIAPYFLHADAFEINNALGANANMHNLLNIYYSFPCVENSSKLDQISLAANLKSKDLKQFGTKSCLQPLVFEMIKIEQEGILIKTSEGEICVHFILGLVLGDNSGLNEILDFNVSFSSNYFCRICNEPKSITQYQCTQNNENMRTIESYNRDLEISKPLETGIKTETIFNSIDSFHVTSNFSVDLMHDFHEGIKSYVLCNLIKYCISQKIFSLELLNLRKSCFNYGPIEIEHISKPITTIHLQNNKLKMTARQMMTFVNNFSLIVGDLVPINNEVWDIYLNLLSILDILHSFKIQKSEVQILKYKISHLNSEYVRLFNDTLKPKFHFGLHYPTVIEMSGPPRHFWGMRYEGKHREFTTYTHAITSRKNICLSICKKFQLKFANYLLSKEEPNYNMNLKNKINDFFICEIINASLDIPESYECFSKIVYKGHKYKEGFVLPKYLDRLNVFRIKCIISYKSIVNSCQLFKVVCQLISDIEYDIHYSSYICDPANVENYSILDIDYFDNPPMNLIKIHDGRLMLRIKECS